MSATTAGGFDDPTAQRLEPITTGADPRVVGPLLADALHDRRWLACDVALIAYASRQRSKRSRLMTLGAGRSAFLAPDASTLADQFQAPFGLPIPIGCYALVAARHMAQYGTTPEQLAEVVT